MALPRKHRLLIDSQSLSLFRKKARRTTTFLIHANYTAGQADESRFAVVVSSHISKKAVVRNRLRRLIHEAIVMNLSKLPKIDMVLFPKKQMADCDKEQIENEVAMLFKKIHI